MPILTFSTMLDKLLSEQKKQTIRYNAEYWQKWIDKDMTLHIWWRNPRTRKYNPDCRKLGIAKGKIEPIYGREFTESLALRDGFEPKGEETALYHLYLFLCNAHGIKDLMEFQHHLFVVIRWEWKEKYWEK